MSALRGGGGEEKKSEVDFIQNLQLARRILKRRDQHTVRGVLEYDIYCRGPHCEIHYTTSGTWRGKLSLYTHDRPRRGFL